MMDHGKKHYITLIAIVDEFEGEPQLLEPEKCEGWFWKSLNDLPEPLFHCIPSLIEKEGIQNLKRLIHIDS